MTYPSYLPGLNTVRFYAAISVVMAHVWHGVTVNPFFLSGWNAVTLFFVLSGYLITYRLLMERKRRGEYDLKAFYIRRELRILPLYYLSILVGAVLLPLVGAPIVPAREFIEAVVMLPQLAHASGVGQVGLIAPLWSIGVEECFYLTFPFLLRRFALVPLAWTIGILSVVIAALAWASDMYAYHLASMMRFECMAVGALTAYAVVNHSRWLVVFRHRAVEAVVLFALVSVIAFDLPLPLHDVFFSVLCAVFLLNVSTNPRSLLKLEYRWSRAAGELTYGIYVWHWIVIWMLAFLFAGHALAVATIAVTLAVAALSYRFIEKPILGFKDRWRSPVSVAVPT